ncbi:MAG: magnesium/cobalt transporter CorA [Actinobacteria bacterium]|nr:magnesium/cobalt transporter CorA [Actinomycetota bacterium]
MISTYAKNKGAVKEINKDEIQILLQDEENIIWVDLDNPDESEIYRVLKDTFGFHPLTIEDCIKGQQRPKIEDFDRYIFMVLFDADMNKDGTIINEELDIFFGKNFIITHHKEQIEAIDYLKKSMSSNPKLFENGADYLLYFILDRVIDSYFPVMDKIDDDIDVIENKVVTESNQQVMNYIFGLRRNLVHLRKVLSPQREILVQLTTRDFVYIDPETIIYFRDIYDHIIRIIEMMESYRDLISGSMEIYLSTISNNLNKIMKQLTLIATIFMPITFITGLFGMNFRLMAYDYGWLWFASFGFMVLISLAMAVWFRMRRWI